MGWKEAKFIYLNGLDYHEKIITYEDWQEEAELIGVKNIHYDATNVSAPLIRAMQKDIGKEFRELWKKHPFHIERTTYNKSNATNRMVIVGENCLVVKKGSFCDEQILNQYQRYISKYLERIKDYDIVKEELYEPLVDRFEKMMDDKIPKEELRTVCFIQPQDVYLEILCVLNGLSGVNDSPSYYKQAKEKVKKLIEHSK